MELLFVWASHQTFLHPILNSQKHENALKSLIMKVILVKKIHFSLHGYVGIFFFLI